MSGMRSYNPEQIMLSAAVRRSSRDLNVMKEKLIFSGKSVCLSPLDVFYCVVVVVVVLVWAPELREKS